jgi:hypothetical protein
MDRYRLARTAAAADQDRIRSAAAQQRLQVVRVANGSGSSGCRRRSGRDRGCARVRRSGRALARFREEEQKRRLAAKVFAREDGPRQPAGPRR